MSDVDYSKEFEAIAKAYEKAGGDANIFKSGKCAGMVVKENKILMVNEVEGIKLIGKELEKGIEAKILVKKNAIISKPVHLCFGVIPKEGRQEIISEFIIEENAQVKFIAHCTFPNAVKVTHVMNSKVFVGENASFEYEETHYHGNESGTVIFAITKAEVGKNGKFLSEFKLIKGTVGKLNFDYEVKLDKEAVAELTAKVYGKKNDEIKVKESIYLNGERSRGIAKSRIVCIDNASSEVIGETFGNAPYSRGHVDCIEIVEGNATAKAIPLVAVSNEKAKVTHEAAIGSVDKKQVETLMSRGLEEQEAVDVVVKGLLT